MTVRAAAVTLWLLTAVPALTEGLFGWLSSPYGDTLHSAESGLRATATVGLWAGFGLVGVVMLLPGPLPLTVSRVVVPASAMAALWAVATVDERSWAGHGLVVLAAAAATVVVLLPGYGEAVIDAASYGDEHRFLLRPSGPVLIALVAPTWAVTVVGAVAGPWLLASQLWVAGAAATLAGVPCALLGVRALNRLAGRWLVFVPTGVVLHDSVALAQPLPITRRGVASIGPAPALTTATDLTAQAFGLALQLRLTQPVTAVLATGRGKSIDQTVTGILVSPSRPAAVMVMASRRGIPLAVV